MSYTDNDFRLYHHGVKGQKWGVRRYQNDDGTLTDAGKKRYSVQYTERTRAKHDERVNKLISEARSADYSTDKARYKMAKRFAKELNNEDWSRAESYINNNEKRTWAKDYSDKAKKLLTSKPNSNRVDKYIDMAEGYAVDSLVYKEAMEASVGRMNALINEANSLGLRISYSETRRSAGGDGVTYTYSTSGTKFKAVKPQKASNDRN